MITSDAQLLRELRDLEARLMKQKAYISATVVMHAILRITQLIVESAVDAKPNAQSLVDMVRELEP
jgi:hypothetical protein